MKKLIILIIAAVGISFFMKDNEYIEIPSSSIRMRVIAASDGEADQHNKKIVKDAISLKLSQLMNEDSSYKEADQILRENLDDLEETVRDAIKNNNMNIDFQANYGLNYFPEKSYKGLTYEAGNYNSYVVTLGEGKGENWWCVLYPPLCLVDEEKSDYEYHSLIKDVLNKYN